MENQFHVMCAESELAGSQTKEQFYVNQNSKLISVNNENTFASINTKRRELKWWSEGRVDFLWF